MIKWLETLRYSAEGCGIESWLGSVNLTVIGYHFRIQEESRKFSGLSAGLLI